MDGFIDVRVKDFTRSRESCLNAPNSFSPAHRLSLVVESQIRSLSDRSWNEFQQTCTWCKKSSLHCFQRKVAMEVDTGFTLVKKLLIIGWYLFIVMVAKLLLVNGEQAGD